MSKEIVLIPFQSPKFSQRTVTLPTGGSLKERQKIVLKIIAEVTPHGLLFTIKEFAESPSRGTLERTLGRYNYTPAELEGYMESFKVAMASIVLEGVFNGEVTGRTAHTFMTSILSWIDPEWYREFFNEAWTRKRDKVVLDATKAIADIGDWA